MEITDEKIFKVALITTLIGLVRMIIFAGDISPKEALVKDINRGMIDEDVTIMIFESTIAEFHEAGIDLKSFKNKKVKIVGTVTEFKSAMELILLNSNSIKIEKLKSSISIFQLISTHFILFLLLFYFILFHFFTLIYLLLINLFNESKIS